MGGRWVAALGWRRWVAALGNVWRHCPQRPNEVYGVSQRSTLTILEIRAYRAAVHHSAKSGISSGRQVGDFSPRAGRWVGNFSPRRPRQRRSPLSSVPDARNGPAAGSLSCGRVPRHGSDPSRQRFAEWPGWQRLAELTRLADAEASAPVVWTGAGPPFGLRRPGGKRPLRGRGSTLGTLCRNSGQCPDLRRRDPPPLHRCRRLVWAQWTAATRRSAAPHRLRGAARRRYAAPHCSAGLQVLAIRAV